MVQCGLWCLVDLNSDLYRLCGSPHGPDTFWARGLNWIKKETTTTTTETNEIWIGDSGWPDLWKTKLKKFLVRNVITDFPITLFHPRRCKTSLVVRARDWQSRGRRFDSGKKSNIEKSYLHGFELHKPSNKGTKLMFHVINTTINQWICYQARIQFVFLTCFGSITSVRARGTYESLSSPRSATR